MWRGPSDEEEPPRPTPTVAYIWVHKTLKPYLAMQYPPLIQAGPALTDQKQPCTQDGKRAKKEKMGNRNKRIGQERTLDAAFIQNPRKREQENKYWTRNNTTEQDGKQKPQETIILSRKNKRNREKQRKIQRLETKTRKWKRVGRTDKTTTVHDNPENTYQHGRWTQNPKYSKSQSGLNERNPHSARNNQRAN